MPKITKAQVELKKKALKAFAEIDGCVDLSEWPSFWQGYKAGFQEGWQEALSK